MGILNRSAAALALAAISLLASGCDKDEECAKRTCPNIKSTKPADLLDLDVQVSSGWDSVWVEIHAGDAVENAPLFSAWSGSGARTLSVGEGSWSGHAVYIRPGDTLDTYDADATSWDETTDECGCFEDWTPANGRLDLRAR